MAAGAVKAGKAAAFVSMGSTGASIAAATVVFGTMEGVDRGALGGPIVGYAPNTVIIDLGTNVDTRPQQLLDFAALGSVISRLIYGADNPRVAILSVGSEAGKGNRQVRETSELLNASSLNFIGNLGTRRSARRQRRGGNLRWVCGQHGAKTDRSPGSGDCHGHRGSSGPNRFRGGACT